MHCEEMRFQDHSRHKNLGFDDQTTNENSKFTPGKVFPVGWVSRAQSEEVKRGIIVVVRSGAMLPSQLQ